MRGRSFSSLVIQELIRHSDFVIGHFSRQMA